MNRLAFLVAVMFFAIVFTSVVAAQSATDYSAYEVLSVEEFDLYASPAQTAAHLSPDGTRFVHFARGDMCLYSLNNGNWAEERCFDIQADVTRGVTEDAVWSPDGRYLALGTYQEALLMVRDTDIRVLDVETGAVINLTDDGVEAGLLSGEFGNADISPRWLDEDTLVFIRYTPDPQATADADWNQAYLPPVLMQIDLVTDGSAAEPEVLTALIEVGLYRIYLLSLDLPRGLGAVNLDLIPDDGGTNLLRVALDGSGVAPFAADPVDYGITGMIDYSADGQSLLISTADQPAEYTMQIVSTVSGQRFDIDPTFPTGNEAARLYGAGWSPEGSAMAYVIRDFENPDRSGLYITPEAGKAGRLILQGDYFGTTCCLRMPITWAENDVILIGRGPAPGVLLVQVGVTGD